MSGIYLFCLVLALHCRDLGLEGVGVLDRLVENKLYYKFVDYGERIKD